MNSTTGLTENIVQAFSWMLIHSLWQGLILSFVAGIILMLTRKAGAALRYNLVLALFAVFLFTALGTFCYEWSSQHTFVQPQLGLVTTHRTVVSTLPTNLVVQANHVASSYTIKTYIIAFSNYFSQHSFMIVMLWFIFFIAKAVSMTGNILYMQRAKHYRVFSPPGEWQEKIVSLCEKLQLKRAVTLLESGYVKIPVVIGHLKPFILIPIGLIAGLPEAQVEAVLLHELAHIRRNDYIINFLQNVTETVFFFNPGLLWISSLLREERENCCDDMAIAQTNNKEDFVHALISFKEYSVATSSYAIAFSGQKSTLLNRVMRIVYQENKTLSIKENGIVIGALLTLSLMAFTLYPVKEIKHAKPHNEIAKVVSPILNDALKQPAIITEELVAVNEPVFIPDTTTAPIVLPNNASDITDSKDTTKNNGDTEPPYEQIRDLIRTAKFDDSKFYSRVVLGDNVCDIIRVLFPSGSKLVATLPHNAKVAIIVKGVLHEESEANSLTPQEIEEFGKGTNAVGFNKARIKDLYPGIDVSKYGTFVELGANRADFEKELQQLKAQKAAGRTP